MQPVRGAEFIRRVRKLGRRNDVPVAYDARRGAGSHGRVYYGTRFTIFIDPRHEIARGLLRKMCRDLGIDPRDI